MQANETIIKDTTANPAPLGLFAFGLTTVLLNVHNAGFIGLSSMIMAMGICYGGVAQVIVGAMEWKKKNTFGTLAFTSYGLFWLSLVTLWLLPKVAGVAAPDKASVGCYLAAWGVFSAVLFVGTLRVSAALSTVFALLVGLFGLLALGDFTGNAAITTVAGWEGIVTGLSAMYLGSAQVLNEMYGRELLPVGAYVAPAATGLALVEKKAA